MDADGTGAQRITHWKLRVADIDRSPEGSLISFRPEETGMDKVGDIYTVRPGGSDLTRLTDSEGDAEVYARCSHRTASNWSSR